MTSWRLECPVVDEPHAALGGIEKNSAAALRHEHSIIADTFVGNYVYVVPAPVQQHFSDDLQLESISLFKAHSMGDCSWNWQGAGVARASDPNFVPAFERSHWLPLNSSRTYSSNMY